MMCISGRALPLTGTFMNLDEDSKGMEKQHFLFFQTFTHDSITLLY